MSCDLAMNAPRCPKAAHQKILALVEASPTALLARDLERRVMAEMGLARRATRRLIHEMVARRHLAYRVDLGHTFIGRAHDTPRSIGERIVIVPQGQRWRCGPSEVEVTLQRGVAFGYGSHATTLLCLEGLAGLFPAADASPPMTRSRLCDVGTGSGILALAGLRLGIDSALAIDTDSCARHEARANAQLNQVADRITIRADGLEGGDGQFDLILANLRWPTLSQMGRVFSAHLKDSGALVVSGLRPEEANALITSYQMLGLDCAWQAERHRWSGLVFRPIGAKNTVFLKDQSVN